MPGIANRQPGPAGAALGDGRPWCGLIADGHHVHPLMMRAALAARPRGRMMLVTDAMPPTGTDADRFELNGRTIYRLAVKDVPVDGFWSISVYNKDGYFEPNEHGVYSVNDITARKGADGSVAVQFGGYDGKTPNCIPITPGWNYLVRLYRPRPEVLSGAWKFPEAQPVR